MLKNTFSFVQSESLSQPYGNCTEQGTLALFEYEPYTRNRCWLECETLLLNETCGCVLHYMPGDTWGTNKTFSFFVSWSNFILLMYCLFLFIVTIPNEQMPTLASIGLPIQLYIWHAHTELVYEWCSPFRSLAFWCILQVTFVSALPMS